MMSETISGLSPSFVSCLRQTGWLVSFRISLVLSCCRNGITDVHYHTYHTASSFMCVTEIQTVALMLARQLIYQFLKAQALNNSLIQGLDWIKLAALLLDSATLMSIIYPDAILLRVIRCSPGTAPPVGIHTAMLRAPWYPEPYDGQALRYQLKARDSISTLPSSSFTRFQPPQGSFLWLQTLCFCWFSFSPLFCSLAYWNGSFNPCTSENTLHSTV